MTHEEHVADALDNVGAAPPRSTLAWRLLLAPKTLWRFYGLYRAHGIPNALRESLKMTRVATFYRRQRS